MLKLSIVCLVAIAVLFSLTSAKELVCNRRNEEYGCGSACQITCDTLNEPCPIVNIKCVDDCYCKPGYARNCRGVCIPIESCPKTKCPRRTSPYLSRLLG